MRYNLGYCTDISLDLVNMRKCIPQRATTSRPSVCPACTAKITDGTSCRRDIALSRARTYYEDVWSQGRILKLNTIMAETHEQHDMVWQPSRVGMGRRTMTRGVLAYRSAYPDLAFNVQDMSYSEQTHSVFVAWSSRGTNLGPIRDQPPSQKVAEFSGISRLMFNEENQIKASFVYRAAAADEARYFLGQLNDQGHPWTVPNASST